MGGRFDGSRVVLMHLLTGLLFDDDQREKMCVARVLASAYTTPIAGIPLHAVRRYCVAL